MSITDLQPIQTQYKGYRFRSRLEARWAVFFDAAGIEWQYEFEGFNVDGRKYLPDFWLPQLQTFVETKPHKAACEQAEPIICSLVRASGHRAIVATGAPDLFKPPQIIMFTKVEDGLALAESVIQKSESPLRQCAFCERVSIRGGPCICACGVVVLHHPSEGSPRIDHAMGEAQRARFEHGEDGRPRPYLVNTPTTSMHVYVAGPVIETTESKDDDGQVWESCKVLPWRNEIFGFDDDDDIVPGSHRDGRFVYGGPTIYRSHGSGNHELAEECLSEAQAAKRAVRLDRWQRDVGTLVEIGAAHAASKPIFIAFASTELSDHFYFVRQLATVAVVAPSAVAAWKLFIQWQNRRAAHAGR